jgi:uncharacterized protein (TIGR02145 family)
MRKFTFLFLLICALVRSHAQNFLIDFAGSGASTTIDSVRVENLTQGTALTVGAGNRLQLLGQLTGILPVSQPLVNQLLIYPNPTAGATVATFNATNEGNAAIELIDNTGKGIFKTQTYLTRGRQSLTINGLGAGIYFLQIQAEAYMYSGKIISCNTTGESLHIAFGEPEPIHTEVLKHSDAVVQMQYTTGDLLKFTGHSDVFSTVFMDVPAQSKTITFSFVPCTDYENHHYAVVQICGQLWMAENLKATKYSNGEDIPEVTGSAQWDNLSTGAYCYFDNNPDYALTYGNLYNWFAAIDNRNICPTGWHVPTDNEWISLTSCLGGEAVAGGKMKEPDTVHWFSPNVGATNESGFSVIAGGNRSFGNFDSMGYGGSFWSVTGIDDVFAWGRDIFYYNTVANRHGTDKKSGLSIRCIKD